MRFIIVLAMLYRCELNETLHLQIVQYKDVTLSSCGLKSFDSIAPKISSCLKLKKSIRDELREEKLLSHIYKGRYAKNGEFPYTVYIKPGNTLCTGAVINENWIITVAHCLQKFEARYYKIYTGIFSYYDTYLYDPYKADKLFIHEQLENSDHDIGLIKLSKKIDTNRKTTNGVCLPDKHTKINFNELAVLTGWGSVEDHTPNRHKLKITQIKLGGFYEYNNSAIISRDMSYGVACPGDSGGPLVQYVNGRAVLIGLLKGTTYEVGTNTTCGPVLAMNFASVPYYMDWIINTILSN